MDYLVNINWNKITPCLVLLVLEVMLEFSECATPAEVNKHLDLGRDFLARGQLSDALTHYHAAVVCYFSARALVKLENYRQTYAEPYNEEAISQYHKIDAYIEDLRLVEAYYRGGDYRAAVELATRLLDTSPWSAHLRQLRAECYIGLNDLFSAVSDIRSVNRLQQDSTDGYYRLATLLYQLGHVNDALKEIRECLKLDPEHKKCFPFYKKVKKVDKFLLDCEQASEARDYSACVASANKLLRAETDVTLVRLRRQALALLLSHQVAVYSTKLNINKTLSIEGKDEQWTEALSACGSALELQRDARVLCDRGDALLGLDMFDDAIQSFKEALELEEGLQRAKDGLSRAQKLQKMSEQRDYYKILGVKRSASKQEIIKAYRKAAQKWHPDNFQGDEKKLAEKKFIDIAAAKEVLTDPEKRAQFDAGSDPLDPEAQRGGGGGPFHNPFHHFQHGSPFQFKFHFN
ncbi:hypothetical protein HW555_006951 [Spodoptera exigua]|uniref:J domain-containing protein n=1 Tax=Spodoptera exigua TaxID=7107 RepID=A0A835GFM0_SPOEX|nr:hypothetical protein HW555_006951 [Spodoptera exigua]